MRKVSVVVPVYNEEVLLPLFLDRVLDAVDEVVVVDGSSNGESVDKTARIVSGYDGKKPKYLSGTFESGGRWDRAAQVNAGIEKASGDVIIYSSIDVVFTGFFKMVQALKDDDSPICYMPSLEFWLDTNHVRLASENNPYTVEVVAMDRGVKPHYGDNGFASEVTIHESDKTLFVNGTRYHLGWVRPFADQVRKHIRNIKGGSWGETGEKVIELGEPAIEAWAIHHIFRYRNGPHAPVLPVVGLPDGLVGMQCMDGLDEYVADYKDRYKEDFYVGIMRSLPPELIA